MEMLYGRLPYNFFFHHIRLNGGLHVSGQVTITAEVYRDITTNTYDMQNM